MKKFYTLGILVIGFMASAMAQTVGSTFLDTNIHRQVYKYTITSDTTPYTVSIGVVEQFNDSLVLPSSVVHNGNTYTVTGISDSGFFCSSYSASSIRGIVIPNTVTTIGSCAFFNCSQLASAILPNSVTKIGEKAFIGCRSLTTLTIPSSVTSIERYAFEYSGLVTITIPNSVTLLGDGLFLYCDSLTNVTLPSTLDSLIDYTFYHCSNLATVDIPSSVSYIGRSAFSGCTSLTAVTIPEGVDSIRDYTFNDCYSLASVDLPSTLKHIGHLAFHHCNSLASIDIPYGVNTIGILAFYSCSGLTTFTIPKTVNSIGNNAFADCSNLDTVTSLAYAVPTTGVNTFYGIPSSCQLIVPCTRATAYAQSWSHFTNISEALSHQLEVSSIDDRFGHVSVTQQPSCSLPAIITATPEANCYFVLWSDGDTCNPRTITLTSDTSIRAIFCPTTFLDTVYVNNYIHDTIVLHDTVIRDFTYHTLQILSENEERGIVSGNGLFPEGSRVDIAAIPLNGYRFLWWQDGSMDNPRTVVVDQSATFVATFGRLEDITDVQGIQHTITTEGNSITVTGAPNATIRIFDSVGRIISTTQSASEVRVYNMPAMGVYMVQVGSYPAERVVVVY